MSGSGKDTSDQGSKGTFRQIGETPRNKQSGFEERCDEIPGNANKKSEKDRRQMLEQCPA